MNTLNTTAAVLPTITVQNDFEGNDGTKWTKGSVLDTKEKIVAYYRAMVDFDCTEDDIAEHANISDDRLFDIVCSVEGDNDDAEVIRCETIHTEPATNAEAAE